MEKIKNEKDFIDYEGMKSLFCLMLNDKNKIDVFNFELNGKTYTIDKTNYGYLKISEGNRELKLVISHQANNIWTRSVFTNSDCVNSTLELESNKIEVLDCFGIDYLDASKLASKEIYTSKKENISSQIKKYDINTFKFTSNYKNVAGKDKIINFLIKIDDDFITIFDGIDKFVFTKNFQLVTVNDEIVKYKANEIKDVLRKFDKALGVYIEKIENGKKMFNSDELLEINNKLKEKLNERNKTKVK